MEPKVPVVLVVLIETAQLRWFVAALRLEGAVLPLLRSEVGDLSRCQGLDFEEQLSFLRHRFCGVLQRGCDRLWARNHKAGQFVFVFDGVLPGTTAQLTARVAEHLVEWLLNPPVAVFLQADGFGLSPARSLTQLAGALEPPFQELLHTGLEQVRTAKADLDAWELSPKKIPSDAARPDRG